MEQHTTPQPAEAPKQTNTRPSRAWRVTFWCAVVGCVAFPALSWVLLYLKVGAAFAEEPVIEKVLGLCIYVALFAAVFSVLLTISGVASWTGRRLRRTG